MSEAIDKNKIIQIGIRVNDIDKAAEEWKAFLGIEPIMGETEAQEYTHAEYYGEPTHAKLRQALFDIENIEIELISTQDDIPSGWAEGLGNPKAEGLHHLAFYTKDMDKAIEVMKNNGFEMTQKGDWRGDAPGSYAYFDGSDRLKTIIELLKF